MTTRISEFILLPAGGKSHRIRKVDIVRVETCSKRVVIFVSSGNQYVYSYHLKVLEEQLNSSMFFRVHKSYLINLNLIQEIDWNEGVVLMIDKSLIPISTRLKPALKKLLR